MIHRVRILSTLNFLRLLKPRRHGRPHLQPAPLLSPPQTTMQAFVLTPVYRLPAAAPRVCMTMRSNRYNAAFRRWQPAKPSSSPGGSPSIPISENGNGTAHNEPFLDSTSPPPPSPPAQFQDRPERPEGESEDDAAPPLHDKNQKIAWPALQNRLLANPRLPLQLAVELTVGFVSKTLAEVQDRGQDFFKQFDHYLCNLSLELFGDAMLVWLLSPVAGSASSLPKHFLQVGNYTVGQRLAGFIYKGVQFGIVGVASSAVGQGATRLLVRARGGDTEELPEVVPNCLAWGGFLLLSSNTRYQLINGFEQRALGKLLPGGMLGAGMTFAVRFGNCYLGGVQWLPWARFLGVQ